MQAYLYIIKLGRADGADHAGKFYVEIGHSRNPYARLFELNGANPSRCSLVATIACDVVMAEQVRRYNFQRQVSDSTFVFTEAELDGLVASSWSMIAGGFRN